MNPLAVNIWMYVLAAYILVSFTIFIVARVSPYEWHNPHPCDTHSDLIENQFTIANSFWFTIGTLMQQGSDLNPKVINWLYFWLCEHNISMAYISYMLSYFGLSFIQKT